MELLIPSLAMLLFGVAIAFFVVPTVAPDMLVAGSIIVIILAAYLHMTKFGNEEYDRSTWQNNLRNYARWVIIIVVIFAAYSFYAGNMGSVSTMRGGNMDSVFKTVASRIGELMRKGRISLD